MLTRRSLDIEDARRLIAGTRARSNEIGVPMCIAVADCGGNLIAFERMDGWKVTSIHVAIDKAFTAAGGGKATHEYGKASLPGGGLYGIASAIGGRLVTVGGGLPVIVDGEVVGGIGVSSGTPMENIDVAKSGIKHFNDL